MKRSEVIKALEVSLQRRRLCVCVSSYDICIYLRAVFFFRSTDDNKSRKTRKIDDNPRILHWYDIAITVPIEILIISRVYLRACLVNSLPGKTCGDFVVKFKTTGSGKAHGSVGKCFQPGRLSSQQLNWNGKTGSGGLTGC